MLITTVFSKHVFDTQVGRLASNTLTFHPDVAEFHFEDYQRLLHISGIELRLVFRTAS